MGLSVIIGLVIALVLFAVVSAVMGTRWRGDRKAIEDELNRQ